MWGGGRSWGHFRVSVSAGRGQQSQQRGAWSAHWGEKEVFSSSDSPEHQAWQTGSGVLRVGKWGAAVAGTAALGGCASF